MKSGYIAVIAGTTESKTIIEQFIKERKEIAAFTATKLGTEMLQNYDIDIVEGRKDKEQFYRFFRAFKPSKVYDASHPFAQEVTKNVKDVCFRLSIPYERVKREQMEYDYEKVVYAADTAEAVELLKEMEGNILLTTGVKTAKEYYDALDSSRLYIRVLQSGNSTQICREIGYEPSHIFGEDPPFSVGANEQLIRKSEASVLVSKDSGRQGGVPEKVAAAKNCDIPVILIRRPENSRKNPRVMIAAAGSGSGKTTLTLGLMKAFCGQGNVVQGFKCGPDYIDPMYHKRVTKRPSVNLDPIFHKSELNHLIAWYGKGSDLSILEGVMGFYDGKGGTVFGSTYETAHETGTPVILVIRAKGIGNTLIPLIQGMLHYRETTIRGIILNQCSEGFYRQIKPAIEKECGVQVIGYLPDLAQIRLKSRHLGLHMADEMKNWDQYLEILENQIRKTIDLPAIQDIACQAEPLEQEAERKRKQYPISIAVAMDEAFCFYYEDNLRLLKEYGVRLVPFSPLYDEQLPDHIQGIYIGGGYPELYAQRLQENENLRMQIREWCQAGKPVIAECGGYMYLGDSIIDQDGTEYSMCHAFPHKTEMMQNLNMHFGYVTVYPDTSNEDLPKELLEKGVFAHEFHYSKESGDHFTCRVEKNEKKQWKSGYFMKKQYAAYPHLSFRGNETFLEHYLEQMQEEIGWKESF